MPNQTPNSANEADVISSAKAASSTLFLGQSGEWWDIVLIVSLILTALVASSVGVATAGSIFAHKREAQAAEAELERFKTETAGRIADASKAGFAAGEAAGAALAKAATLQSEADRAKLETEKLKKTVSWRELDERSVETLITALSVSVNGVNLRFSDGDSEALFLALQFSRVFEAASWRVGSGALKFNGIIFGVVLSGPESETKGILKNALTTVGIPFVIGELPVGVGFMTTNSIEGAPTLFIGSRIPSTLK